MPVLYHYPLSPASRFIRLCLGEYNLKTDLSEEYPWEKRRDFLALNPAGNLPVYVDDTMRALCGPHVMAEYLDETHGILLREKRLLAEDPFDRAEIRRLMEWFLVKFENEVAKPILQERVYKLFISAAQGSAPDSKKLRTARSNIQLHMKYLSWLAGSRSWLGGDRISYADLAAAGSISTLDYLGEIHWSHFPQAKEWYQRVKSRPSFRSILSERISKLPPVAHYTDLDF
jgi:glutathione S-transferase